MRDSVEPEGWRDQGDWGDWATLLSARITRIEELVVKLCEYAGIAVGRQDKLRAFITCDEGLRWWDVEETKANAVGFDCLDMFELGARVTFWLCGWLEHKEKKEEPLIKPIPYQGGYL